MKSRFIILFVLLNMAWFRPIMAQGTIKSDSLDSVLLGLKDPKEKVDVILKFLEFPENQYDENAIEYANRAFQIARETDYSIGKINSMLVLSKYYFRKSDYKKAMELAQDAKEMSEDLNYEPGLANAYGRIGTVYNELSDYDNSSEYFFKSLRLFEKMGDKVGISHALGDIGMDFFYQKNFSKALDYDKKSLAIALEINSPTAIKRQYNNIAAIYQNLEKYDTAIVFLRKALDINIKLGDRLSQGINIMNIGYGQMNNGYYEDALRSFKQSLDIATELNNQSHMAQCYLNFGICYYSDKRFDESIPYFKKALEIGQRNKLYLIINTAAQILNELYTSEADTLNAYKYIKLEKMAGDSLFNSQKQRLISKLEMQYNYEKKEFDRQLAQQTKNAVMLIIIFGLVSGLVILGLIFSRHRLKSKFIVLEKEKIESELGIKNRELTVNLISLIKKNEMLTDISNKLVQLESNAKGLEAKEIITLISRELRNSTDDKMHNEFSQRFQEVHAGFYEKLLQSYPDLTQNELKLCAFLRLNMSTKDISELTNQQLPSIDQARYRLRKKLGISNSETNLVTFLSQI
ncbi:MAG: tetratricopeptide repeat protein [Bacteroidales bacterium]|nr:tetratricopeptide repeat protein [Bacteroidales bacterium]